MPISTGQIIMTGCFQYKILSSAFKDGIIQWQFHKVKIRCFDCPKELFSKVTYIANGIIVMRKL